MDNIFRADVWKKGHPNNQFQNYKGIDNSHKFHQNNHNSCQFPTGTMSFQVSQQIKPGDDISFSVNTIKHFRSRIGEKYALQKKTNTLWDATKLQDIVIHEVMETITMMNDNKIEQSVHEAADEIYRASLINTSTWCYPIKLTIYRYCHCC